MKQRSLYFTNRKEYYRRKKISIGLKRYYQNKKAKEQVQKSFKESTIKTKTRTQLTINSDYAISLRAISLNNHTEKELEDAITEFLNSNPYLLTIPFNSEGFEEEEIGKDEDKGLSTTKITIELNIRGKTTYTEI